MTSGRPIEPSTDLKPTRAEVGSQQLALFGPPKPPARACQGCGHRMHGVPEWRTYCKKCFREIARAEREIERLRGKFGEGER